MSTTINTVNADQFRNAVFFSLSLHRWTNRAQEKRSDKIQAYLEQMTAPDTNGNGTEKPAPRLEGNSTGNNRTKTTKILVTSTALDAINEYLNATKTELCGPYGLCNPSMIKEGLFVVSKAEIQRVEDRLRDAVGYTDETGKVFPGELQKKFLPDLLRDYPLAIERAQFTPVKKGGLGPIFNAADYPTPDELAEMFSLDWQWLSLGVPEDLPSELRAEAANKLERQFTEAAEEVKNALREGFAALIDHALDKLTVQPGEKPKVFRDTLIGNVQAFVDVFNARNIMNDSALADLVAKAKSVLQSGVSAQKLRDYQSVRDNTVKQFGAIKTALDGMITTRAARKIELPEDETPAAAPAPAGELALT